MMARDADAACSHARALRRVRSSCAVFQLFVQLAFCWANPRHGHALFDTPRPNQTFVNQATSLAKLDEATVVPNAVKRCIEECLPRMKGTGGDDYRARLKADRDAQGVFSSYEVELEQWAARLRASLASTRLDPLELFSRALDAKRCLGSVSVPITDRHGHQKQYRASLSASQARVCLLEAQRDVIGLALGRNVSLFDTPTLLEALARCGEVKYGSVEAMHGCAGGAPRPSSHAARRGPRHTLHDAALATCCTP